jgi:DNA-binding transcriptional ArsR family regulator
MTADAAKIKQMLMVDEAQLAEEMLERVRNHLGLTPRGQVYIREPRRYRQRDLVLLYLTGVRYAADAKLRQSDSAALSEICENLGLDSRVVAARLGELRNEGKVESPARGENQIVFPRLLSILNEIEEQGESGAK